MLQLTLSGSTTQKVVFYTPEDTGYQVGDEIYIEFTSELTQHSQSIEKAVDLKVPNYLGFYLPTVDLPQTGGFYTVTLNESTLWEDVETTWETTPWSWGDDLLTPFDTERCFILQAVVEQDIVSSSLSNDENDLIRVANEDTGGITHTVSRNDFNYIRVANG